MKDDSVQVINMNESVIHELKECVGFDGINIQITGTHIDSIDSIEIRFKEEKQ